MNKHAQLFSDDEKEAIIETAKNPDNGDFRFAEFLRLIAEAKDKKGLTDG